MLWSCPQSHHRSAAPQTFSLSAFCFISRHWCGLGCNSLAIRVIRAKLLALKAVAVFLCVQEFAQWKSALQKWISP